MLQFRTLTDLDQLLRRRLSVLPRGLDLVVGIPRSGLLPATIISHYLNLPLTDLEGLCEGRLFRSPQSSMAEDSEDLFNRRLRVLIVDDSVWTGTQLQAGRKRIAQAGLEHQFYYCAVYVTREGERLVDYAFEILPKSRFFAWNLTNHWMLARACIDIDGVICVDPTPEQNDDGIEYRRFLWDAAPLYIPALEVGWLVTCRLEKYRGLTERWLARRDVRYRHLIMMDLPTKEARIRLSKHAKSKADVYRATGAHVFIESSRHQAREIAQISGLPVLCMDTRSMVYPTILARLGRTPLVIQKCLRSMRRRLSGLLQRTS